MKICLFGGTFDPIHIGHQNIINNLLVSDYDLIIIMPTGNVDYKKITTDKKHRLNMCQLWAKSLGDDRVIVDDYEVLNSNISYTADTISYLLDKYNIDTIDMAIGYDSYIDLENWNNSEYLKEKVNFVVFNRDGSHNYLGETIDISSTALRHYFDPTKVVAPILPYIVEHQIYDLQPYIVNYECVAANIDPQLEIIKRVNYIKQMLLSSPCKNLVIAISGGQDSTLCGKLCALAIESLGPDYQLHLLRLPFGTQADEDDCQLALDFIGRNHNIHTFNIKQATNIVDEEVDNNSDFNKGNIKARMRMIYQYALAGKIGALVVGTDHSSENAVGFFTKYGDGGVDFNPLFGLNKRQGKELLKALDCPSILFEKVPTADLEENKPQLADEVAMGFTYNTLDDYLENKEVNLIDKIKIETKFIQTMHKRHLNFYGDNNE